jgi:hypothetical protein
MPACSASFSDDNEKKVLIELFSDNAGSREPRERDASWETREDGSEGDEARLEDLFPDEGTEGKGPETSESETTI